MTSKWSNWAGNERSRPLSIASPKTEDELVSLIGAARDRGETVKIPGSGHSFTAAAATNGRMIRLDRFSGIRSVDRTSKIVKVGAGTRLEDLNVLLHAQGLALPNLGDIAYQTVAGALSTSTHGTGAKVPGLAAQVTGFRLVTADGQVLECDREQNPDVFDLGRVSVGALGAITEYSIQAVDSFALRAREEPMRLDAVLGQVHELASVNDHFEFFWIPHTKWALTKRNNRTTEALAPLPKVRGWVEKTFMENYAFGALCHLGRIKPSLIPRLATALPSSGSREYVDQSYKIFASPRLVHFYEMEHSIPATSLEPALRDIVSMIDKKGYLLNFPVEVRFTAADDVALSTSYGRASAYIAVHVFRGMDHKPFFKDVEDILRGYDARPHWGKIHNRVKDEFVSMYPRFNEFLALRDRLDSGRTFANDYTRRVFGD